MNNLPDIRKKTELSQTTGLHLPGTCKSLDVRREMLNVPQVIEALTPVEKTMFLASTKTPISELEQQDLLDKITKLTKYISIDVGIKNIDGYYVTRFTDILLKYYSNLSISEIKLAFELSMAGELDAFLPKDKDGRPDKNHYQVFNVEYITKILNAYKKRSREAEHKAYMALPAPKNELTPETKELYRQNTINMIIGKFKEYRTTGKIKFDDVNDFVIYNELEAKGLALPIEVTEDDSKAAVKQLIKKAQSGLINKFVGECIRRMQTRHSDVPGQALILARQRAIIQSFDKIIKDNIQLTEYFKL